MLADPKNSLEEGNPETKTIHVKQTHPNSNEIHDADSEDIGHLPKSVDQKIGISYRFQICNVKIKETKIHTVLCVLVDKEYGLCFTCMERKNFKDLSKSLCTSI